MTNIAIQLLVGFLPAAVLLLSMRVGVLAQGYSYRDDGFKSVGSALAESRNMKLIITSGFLFFQSLVLNIYAPQSFIFVFVLAVTLVNVAAISCMLTDYNLADDLIAQIRRNRTIGRTKRIDEEFKAFLKDGGYATRRLLARERLKRSSKRFSGNRIMFLSIGLVVLVSFPVLSVSWVYKHYDEFGPAYIEKSKFEASTLALPDGDDMGPGLINPVLAFAIANYGLGTTCAKEEKCPEAVQSFTAIIQGLSYRGGLFLYFFFITFPIVRFLSSLREYTALLKEHNTSDLGLETDVVQNIGYIASIIISLLVSLVLVRVPITEIGIFSGIVAAGVSLALRDTLGNLMAGALLIWDGSLKKGDVITIPQTDTNDTGSTYGIIREMKMRYTVVEDRNTVRRLIPNSVLVSDPIESWTHEDTKVRLSLRIGVAYGTDLAKAKQIMESVCYDVRRIITDKTPQALVVNFGDNSIDFSLRFWLRDTSDGIRPVISEVLTSINQRFNEEGIVIPFPQRTVWLRNEETAQLEKPLAIQISRHATERH